MIALQDKQQHETSASGQPQPVRRGRLRFHVPQTPSIQSNQNQRTRPIRVCYLIDDLSAAGTESQLVALINQLNRTQVEPFLALLKGHSQSTKALEPRDGVALRLGVHSLHQPATIRAGWRFARFLRARRIDILQLYFPDSTYFGAMVGRLARVPRIVGTRNNLGYWVTPLHRCLGRFCQRFIDKVVANCEPCRQAVMHDDNIADSKVVVLENGVDLSRFAVNKQLTVEQPQTQSPRIGIVANLRPVKNLDLFLLAADRISRQFPRATFHIAGEGMLRPKLERMVDNLGLSAKAFLPGSIADVPGFLAGLDVTVLCSQTEGMSNALLEYMAAGKPIVATAVGANPHLIEHGRTGLLVQAGDANQLAQAILRFLRNPPLARQMARAARAKAEQCFGRQTMVRRFEAFYESLMPALPKGSRLSGGEASCSMY